MNATDGTPAKGPSDDLAPAPGVHPQAARLLRLWNTQQAADVETWTPESVRADDEAVLELQRAAPRSVAVSDHELPDTGGVVARIYEPDRNPGLTIIYLHGGGFVIGLEAYDRPLRELAVATRARIVAPNVRLAPEHPFPAPLEDALASAQSVLARIGAKQRVAVAGDSSGGNLAAVVTNELTREGARLDSQVLIYPMLDATASSRSYREFASGFGFSRAKALWYFSQYLPATVDRRNPRVSPLTNDDLAGLPPTLVISAGCDPLRDEGEAFAHSLASHGVKTKLVRYEGMIHGFFQLTAVIDAATDAQKQIARWLTSRHPANLRASSPPPTA